MLANFVRWSAGALLAATSSSLAQIPSSAAANAAVELNSTLGGRVIRCPEGLRISPQAVCLFAEGTVDKFKAPLKAKLGDRVIDDWRTRTGSRNASLLFRTGNDVTYVLLAQADPNAILAIVDAPAAGAARNEGVPFVNAKDLNSLVSVQAADTVGTFTRLGQSVVVTQGNRNARFGTGSVQLAAAPYTEGGKLFVPVTLLNNLGCTVSDVKDNKVTGTCGSKKAALNVILK